MVCFAQWPKHWQRDSGSSFRFRNCSSAGCIRLPTFWFDKVCIDQTRIQDVSGVLPVNVMALKLMYLVAAGKATPARRLHQFSLNLIPPNIHVTSCTSMDATPCDELHAEDRYFVAQCARDGKTVLCWAWDEPSVDVSAFLTMRSKTDTQHAVLVNHAHEDSFVSTRFGRI